MSTVEVFILNYNGNKFLEDCLNAVCSQNLGEHKVTINVIDNCSSITPQRILQNFEAVNYIPLKENIGFSKGNNLGLKLRLEQLEKEGEKYPNYIVFLNNDTIPDKNWLKNAVDIFDKDMKIGIVGSKSLFKDKFIKLTFKSDNGMLSNNHVLFFPKISNSKNINELNRFKFKNSTKCEGGFFIDSKTEIFVPIDDSEKDTKISFDIKNLLNKNIKLKIIKNDEDIILEKNLIYSSTEKFELNFSTQDYKKVIQNAGSFVTKDWSAGDIGFLEVDNGQRDCPCKVMAVCGVSMFIRTSLFQKLNGFEEKTFAYFEDTDLSLRARLLGYDCYYEPLSILKHVHCGSGVEFSEYFNQNVTWSQFVFKSKYASFLLWNKTKKRYFLLAKNEFRQFENDKTLDGKPHLRTFGKYIKNYFFFFKNRVKKFFTFTSRLRKI